MGTASAVAVGDRYYLVDAGSGVGGRLHDSGLGEPGVLDTLAAVFLTHLHSDHVVDLNNLLSFGAFNGLESSGRSVPVWAPATEVPCPRCTVNRTHRNQSPRTIPHRAPARCSS
ncbi:MULTISPECIES: MBL fold metallo-hydrolase [unclassified Streptomyces]|uniref:MBL fold metallo-hydrolase n=1 Tax=unclassified Streptomyces TaxID=2593676 RepID=UPI0038667E1A